jgi:hypothetical protein
VSGVCTMQTTGRPIIVLCTCHAVIVSSVVLSIVCHGIVSDDDE